MISGQTWTDSAGGGKPGETLEKAAEHIMSCFRTCALDSKSTEDVTKRWGMLNIVNQLFKIYFRVNKLHLCKPLIRAIEQSSLKDRYLLTIKTKVKLLGQLEHYLSKSLSKRCISNRKKLALNLKLHFEKFDIWYTDDKM